MKMEMRHKGLLEAQDYSLERLTLTQNLLHLFYSVYHCLLLVSLAGKTLPLLPLQLITLRRELLHSTVG